MMHDKSFTEILKSRNALKTNEETSMLDIYIQMVIDEALYIRKKELLEKEINQALDSRNKELFMKLSSIYKQFNYD
jgi:uncharacterized protein YpiB (UPF0302 family)